jgi:hypothetical protein
MTSARHIEPNTQILRALGITQQNIVAADLSLRPGEWPRITVDCLADPAAMQHEVLAFDLVPREKPAPAPRQPLDLDAMCAAARERLSTATACSAINELEAWRDESRAIQRRVNAALARRRREAYEAIHRQTAQDFMSQFARDLAEQFKDIAKSGAFAGSVLSNVTCGASDFKSAMAGLGMGGHLTGKCRGGF